MASFDSCKLTFIALPHEIFPQNMMCCAGRLSLGVGYRGHIQPCLKGTNPEGVLKGNIKHHLVFPGWGQQLSFGEWPPKTGGSLRGQGCTVANPFLTRTPGFPLHAHVDAWDLPAISHSISLMLITLMANVTCHKPLYFGLGGDLSATPELVADGAPWEDGGLHE